MNKIRNPFSTIKESGIESWNPESTASSPQSKIVPLPSVKRQKPTFHDAITGFPAKWRLRNERRNSILMTCHYPDLGSASDWSCHVGNLIQPIRSTTQIWVVTRHQYGISALISQTSFREETSVGVVKCRLFSQAALHRRTRDITKVARLLGHVTKGTFDWETWVQIFKSGL